MSRGWKPRRWNNAHGSAEEDRGDFVYKGRVVYSGNLPFRLPDFGGVLKRLKKLLSA